MKHQTNNNKQSVQNKSIKPKSATTAKKEYVSMLENLLTYISHNIRKPIAHVNGISYVNQTTDDSLSQLNKKLLYMKQCAILLDKKAKDLSISIFKKLIKLKENDIS